MTSYLQTLAARAVDGTESTIRPRPRPRFESESVDVDDGLRTEQFEAESITAPSPVDRTGPRENSYTAPQSRDNSNRLLQPGSVTQVHVDADRPQSRAREAEPIIHAAASDELRPTAARQEVNGVQGESHEEHRATSPDTRAESQSTTDEKQPVHAEHADSLPEQTIRTRIHVQEPEADVANAEDRGEAQRPIVRIKIGRVDVKAVAPPRREPAAPPKRTEPSLSLRDYLDARRRGER